MFDVELINRTPFSAATHVQMDPAGQEVLVVVICATFQAPDPSGPVCLAKDQEPIRPIDQHRGNPASSSIAVESDISPIKTRVDVLVEATAQAPGGALATDLRVELRVADIHKRLRVVGNRSSLRDTHVLPFSAMPIIYERSLGGHNKKGEWCRENPVGLGWKGASSADPAMNSLTPNIEYADLHDARRGKFTLAAGLGPIARSWFPRLSFAGTYDKEWLESTWPLSPIDFDPLFYQAAPLDQQTERVLGGELVELSHVTSDGLWRFRLPTLDVPMHAVYEDRVESLPVRVDTVAIDANRGIVNLKFRLSFRHVRNAPRLRASSLSGMPRPHGCRPSEMGKRGCRVVTRQ